MCAYEFNPHALHKVKLRVRLGKARPGEDGGTRGGPQGVGRAVVPGCESGGRGQGVRESGHRELRRGDSGRR